MKFGKQLRYECVSEWRTSQQQASSSSQVVDINDENQPLLGGHASNDIPAPSSTSSSMLSLPGSGVPDTIGMRSVTHAQPSPEERERLFIAKLDEEKNKVNSFYILKEKDLIQHYNKLTEHASMILKDKTPNPKLLKDIRRAFLELYKALTMLENYVTLNYTGFQKILKKFDRFSSTGNFQESYMADLAHERFHSDKTWKNMKHDVELLYCKLFKIDKIEKAKMVLRPVSSSNTASWHMMKLGLAIGSIFTSLALIIILFVNGPMVGNPDWDRFISVVPIFRGVGLPILAVWLWGVNVYVWEKQRVNHILIFGFDPRTTVDPTRIFKTASVLTGIWIFTWMLFCGTILGNFSHLGIPAQVYPLALVIFFLLVVFFPFRLFHRKSRLMLFTILGNVMITPFGSIKFRALFLGDVLTSMVKTIFDWEYTACYYITGDWKENFGARCNHVNAIALPIISGLPLLWRLMQCMLLYKATRNKIHLGNTGKYAFGFTVVLFSALNGNYQNYPEPWTPGRVLWCVCFVLATLYMYVWDVFVDWRLMWLKSPRPMLRKHLIYKKHLWVYYYAIISDFFLRFAWTLTITPLQFNIGINNELFVTILATVELIRRFTWASFRVENEHVQNSLTYHAFDMSEVPWSQEINPKRAGGAGGIPVPPSKAEVGGDADFTTASSDNWSKAASQYYSKKSWLDVLSNRFFNKKKGSGIVQQQDEDIDNKEYNIND
ncbi:hypothetical protein SAMD00019534_058090 [Acytostelium subglobosum LB1]|uniref:hypothetical protein n=1 Tax=Acytostelium subglobosum LB1 TaxID=1410327 RepID=UPI000644B9A5|nr:hypothetical protein SAMD00019534_058090 [Acytostelium subglobosum LB1]GAM22634.1 hypothetical protein SAMD00019534_058090 [Acytostelium subglobosum LB1]|eukprot:XP_012754754.1 hypothetical protein SAMD00019534_058090 [Acytostelium subglobosum LB1]